MDNLQKCSITFGATQYRSPPSPPLKKGPSNEDVKAFVESGKKCTLNSFVSDYNELYKSNVVDGPFDFCCNNVKEDEKTVSMMVDKMAVPPEVQNLLKLSDHLTLSAEDVLAIKMITQVAAECLKTTTTIATTETAISLRKTDVVLITKIIKEGGTIRLPDGFECEIAPSQSKWLSCIWPSPPKKHTSPKKHTYTDKDGKEMVDPEEEKQKEEAATEKLKLMTHVAIAAAIVIVIAIAAGVVICLVPGAALPTIAIATSAAGGVSLGVGCNLF